MSSSFADRPSRRARGVAVLGKGLALLAGAAARPGLARAADGPRVIEMVSPPDTAGQSAAPGAARGITEPLLLGDGTFIGYNLLTPLFPDQGNGRGTLWRASRTSAGWRGQLDPPVAQQGGDGMYTVQATTPDGSRTVVKSEQYLCKATQIAEQAATAQNGKTALKSISVATSCALGLVSASHTATALRLAIHGRRSGRSER